MRRRGLRPRQVAWLGVLVVVLGIIGHLVGGAAAHGVVVHGVTVAHHAAAHGGKVKATHVLRVLKVFKLLKWPLRALRLLGGNGGGTQNSGWQQAGQ